MTPFAEPAPPMWFTLITPPQHELLATKRLAEWDMNEAWHPTEMVYIRNRFKPGKRIPRIKPVATGYLLARFDRRAIWPWLFEQSRGAIIDVLRIGERPVAMADVDLMGMKQMPERLRDMREAAKEAATVRPGDTVTIIAGTLAGWTVTVDSVHGGIAKISAPLLGRMPEIEVDKLQKGAA